MTSLDYLLFTVKMLSALGCGLVAGIFFAFSTFVMGALAQLKPDKGIAAMQAINITVINPWFMTAFLGTGVACLILAIASLNWHLPGATYLLIGSLLYLFGTVGVTLAFNVPLNNELAIVKAESIAGAELWAKYLTEWTLWNHFRTAAALMAAALLTLGLCIG